MKNINRSFLGKDISPSGMFNYEKHNFLSSEMGLWEIMSFLLVDDELLKTNN